MESPVLTPSKPAEIPQDDSGSPGQGGWDNGFGGEDGEGNQGDKAPAGIAMTGVWIGIISIVMLFASLTIVFVIRKGIAHDWIKTSLPHIIYLNSVILLASSLTLETSRSALTAGLGRRFLIWLYITLGLGVCFILGQATAWRELVERGIYLSTNPSGFFFYLLTAAHALHLLGGIIALTVLTFRAPKIARGIKSRTFLDAAALYWHFMYALWMYILLLLILTA